MKRYIVALSGGLSSAWCADWAFRYFRQSDIILYFNEDPLGECVGIYGTIAPYGNLTVPLSGSRGLELDAHLRNVLSLYEIVETSILPGSGSYEETEALRYFENTVASRIA